MDHGWQREIYLRNLFLLSYKDADGGVKAMECLEILYGVGWYRL